MAEEITYYTGNDVTVTSHQIRSKTLTIMLDGVVSVEYRSSSLMRIFLIVFSFLMFSGILGAIMENNTLLKKIVLVAICLFLGLGSLSVAISGFAKVYILTQGRRSIIAEGDVSEMRRVKQAIDEALLSNRTQQASFGRRDTQ